MRKMVVFIGDSFSSSYYLTLPYYSKRLIQNVSDEPFTLSILILLSWYFSNAIKDIDCLL